MKKNILIFICCCFFLVSCKPKYGSVTGNVFWKYNDFVGNKPDAGATVNIISKKDTSIYRYIDAKCDIDGNFNFEQLEIGEYLLIISSKNVTGTDLDVLENIRDNSFFIDGYYNGLNLSKSLFLNDSLDYYKSKNNGGMIFLIPIESNFSFYKSLPGRLQYLLNSGPRKIYIDEIKVEENKSTKVIVDFGLNAF